MFLSNLRKSFLVAVFCVVFFQACGSSQNTTNKDISLTGETGSPFPFPTKEPEVYQGDFVVSVNNQEDHYFIARKGDKSRIDYFPNTEKWRIEIRTDKSYSLTPPDKVYVENLEAASQSGVSKLGQNYFSGVEYREFEEVGREGNIIKYLIKPTSSVANQIAVWVDQTNGMVVRQEFTEKYHSSGSPPALYVFEIRNLKLDVDDSIFEIPPGYKNIAVGSNNPPKQNK